MKTGLLLTTLLFVLHLFVINDYGITWDFHHHFFSGLYHLGIPIAPKLTDHIPFTVPDPRGTYDLPFGPLMLITPVSTYLLVFEKLQLLPFDSAYHLGIIVIAMLGILSLYLFLLESQGFKTAILGFFFIALLPRYFGDIHNNMKDVPQSAAFAFAIWMFWRLMTFRRPRDLIMASLSFAIAFNMKVNAVFIPVIAFCWTAVRKQGFARVGWYFFLAPLSALVLWAPFWQDPIDRLIYLFRFFQDNTLNLEVLYFGTIYRSAINVPWHYPFGYLAITTPLPILALFLIGLIRLISPIGLTKKPVASLLLLSFFVPLLRYASPKVGVIDGIRHFEEVVYPLAAIAAVGAVSVARVLGRWLPQAGIRLIGLIGLISLIWNIISYHPFQIAYFNELVGGVRGALGKFDIDYWGTSQKQAVAWLNKNAAKGSVVYVVMAPDAAAKYLRADLLEKVNTTSFDSAGYVVVLNRQSFFYRYYPLADYMTSHTPVFSVTVGGVPMTMIFDNSKPPAPFHEPWWGRARFAR